MIAAGIAFDQVTMVTRSRPLVRATQFELAWNTELAAMKANPTGFGADGLPVGQARHIAWLGDDERVESPIDGRIIIYRYSAHEVVDIDVAKRTYWIRSGTGELYSVTTGMTKPSPAADAASVPAVLHSTLDTFPDTSIDGVIYKGYTGRITQTVDDSRCRYAQSLAFFVAFSDPTRTEPGSRRDTFYAPWLTQAPIGLSRASSCNVIAPENVLGALPFYPSFLLYMVSMPQISNVDMSQRPVDSTSLANVMIRGHVRAIGPADAALFEIPADFTKVDAP